MLTTLQSIWVNFTHNDEEVDFAHNDEKLNLTHSEKPKNKKPKSVWAEEP
jgi:hypothetical protein